MLDENGVSNTFSENPDDPFWMRASEPALKEIWGNDEDDVYAELLIRQTDVHRERE